MLFRGAKSSSYLQFPDDIIIEIVFRAVSLSNELWLNRAQIMRDPKNVVNPGKRFLNVLLGQGNTLLKAGAPQAVGSAKSATPWGLLLSLGGSTDQKNRWSRLGYSSEEDYNNAIAAHKADQAANPQNYDPKALEYQAEFDAEGDKPFLNKVFSNLFSKAEDNKVIQSVPSPADIIAFTEDTGRTAAEAEQILGGGLETVFDGPTAKEQWLAKTANSPAAQAGVFSDDDRWKTHLANQQWRKDKGRSFTHGDFLN